MENVDSIKWEHLKNPEYYIQTSIYNAWWIRAPISEIMKGEFNYIDYYKNNKYVAKNNLESSANNSFVISKLDSSNKYSKWYVNCTWIVAIGESKETLENISFLTHQNNIWFIRDKQKKDLLFKEKLIKSLEELIEKSNEWSIDIVILWWRNDENFEEYIETIEFLDKIIFQIMWFSPSVVWWPSIDLKAWNKDVIVNTKGRNTYLFKEYSNVYENINFVASNVRSILKENNL